MYKATISTPSYEKVLYENVLLDLKNKVYKTIKELNIRSGFATVVYEDDEGYSDSDEFYINGNGKIEF